MTTDDIARTCHEANRAYCESRGDMTQKPWEEAPDWQKESAIAGVTFHLEFPNAGPEVSHENWLKSKVADGWVYGPVKNEEEKTHPCCVPFNELPRWQQGKDFIFVAIVHSLSDSLSKIAVTEE